jgi:hypothetical protein
VRVASTSTGVGNEGEGSEHGGVGNTHEGMGRECTGVRFEYGSEGSLWRAST